ncbi:MAG: guanylate kinase [Cyanobacteria bacterium P01_H01_bin.74]
MPDAFSFKPIPIVISGPSGVGKSTLCKTLIETYRPFFQLSISATTRPPRGAEMNGQHYFFKTLDQFKALIESDKKIPDATRHQLLEWAEYNHNLYGTLREQLENGLQAHKHVILEIEVQGAMQIKEKMPEALLVFIAPPSNLVLENRLRQRGTNTEEDIQERLAIAQKELEQSPHFDLVLVNTTIAGCMALFIDALKSRQYLPSSVSAP